MLVLLCEAFEENYNRMADHSCIQLFTPLNVTLLYLSVFIIFIFKVIVFC